jgi:hypothetical protein
MYLPSTYKEPQSSRVAQQPDPWQPDLGERTSRLEKVKVGNVPTPVIVHAEHLCDLVDDADGIRPDRQDLIAALIHTALEDGDKLAQAWRTYRTAPVHVVLRESQTSGPIDLRPFRRGG